MQTVRKVGGLLIALATSVVVAWPDTPFVTEGNHIRDASGAIVTFAGVNWPGAADTMLPEGLQYKSVVDIIASIKSLGMNIVRLTYAIEVVDDMLRKSPNQTLAATLTTALGPQNGTALLNRILVHNPVLKPTDTRLRLLDYIADECAKQQLWIHLDNHVSKAKWCCDNGDGNTWFNDVFFKAEQWRRALGYMAEHGRKWPALVSMSLRNELRLTSTPNSKAVPYDWYHWYLYMVPAMNIIHGNNSQLLIYVSGINYDTDDSAITNGQHLGGGKYFRLSDFPYANKIVFEIHNYQTEEPNCGAIKSGLYNNGYGIMDPQNTKFPNKAPMVMTEWGFDQPRGASIAYAQCIRDFLTHEMRLYPPHEAGSWMMWTLSGSYYIRSGTLDYDDSWGLFNHDWSAWRNQTVIDTFVKPMVQDTMPSQTLTVKRPRRTAIPA